MRITKISFVVFVSAKVKRRSAVELDILRREVLSSIEHFTLYIEDLHTKTSRLRNAIIDAGISCFGAITYSNEELSGFREEFCLSEMRRLVAHDKLSFDKSLRSGMCPLDILLRVRTVTNLSTCVWWCYNVSFGWYWSYLQPFGYPPSRWEVFSRHLQHPIGCSCGYSLQFDPFEVILIIQWFCSFNFR